MRNFLNSQRRLFRIRRDSMPVNLAFHEGHAFTLDRIGNDKCRFPFCRSRFSKSSDNFIKIMTIDSDRKSVV
jgi:hypothetical protein